ncbi:MAG: pantetheine-phosphate adenylyltransferase [bacterium]
MPEKRVAIYPGSFDPVTNGHIDIIKRGLKVFDELIVAVATNVRKKPLFTVQERIEMLKEVTRGMENVIVDQFEGLLVDYAKRKGVKVILRGLRAVSDFEYEFQMALTNRRLSDNGVDIVFMMPDEKYTYLSATIVRDVARWGGNVDDFVHPAVRKRLQERLEAGDWE